MGKLFRITRSGQNMLKIIKKIIIFSILAYSPCVTMAKLSSPITTNLKESNEIMNNSLTLEKANAIISATLIESKKLRLNPMSVAILDAGGNLIAFQRQDNAGILRFNIAFAKAYGALGMGMGSRGLALKAKEIPEFMNGAINASNGRLIPAPGGVLILDNHNNIIGAAGASGDTSDNDEHSVVMGIQAAGLKPKID